MGMMFKIKLKENADINNMNGALSKLGVPNDFTTIESLNEWLKDINTNPDAPLKKLKPKGKDLTLKQLQEYFPMWTEIGLFETDIAFGRTDVEEMQSIGKFIAENKGSIEYIVNGKELIKRGNISKEYQDAILSLEKEYEEPEKLLKSEQYRPNFQSGLLLCRSFGIKPFWVIYGNVDKPTFMKTKIYKDDLYNNIYRDEKGYGYMLIPLMNLGDADFAKNVFDRAWEMGLREHPDFFIPTVYHYEIADIDDAAERFRLFYTVEEIKERIISTVNAILARSPFKYEDTNKGMFSINKGKIVLNPANQFTETRYLKILNALCKALERSLGKLEIKDREFVFGTERLTV